MEIFWLEWVSWRALHRFIPDGCLIDVGSKKNVFQHKNIQITFHSGVLHFRKGVLRLKLVKFAFLWSIFVDLTSKRQPVHWILFNLTAILEFVKTHLNHSLNDSLDQECVRWNMHKFEWKQMQLWKLMKVCNFHHCTDQLFEGAAFITSTSRTRSVVTILVRPSQIRIGTRTVPGRPVPLTPGINL